MKYILKIVLRTEQKVTLFHTYIRITYLLKIQLNLGIIRRLVKEYLATHVKVTQE